MTIAPDLKLVPARFVMLMVAPVFPEAGVMPVTVGEGRAMTLNPAAFVPVVLSLFVTTTSQLPVTAVAGILTVHIILVGLVTAIVPAIISAWPAFSNFTVAPGLKLVPARFVMFTVVPAVPEVGVIPVTVGEGGAVMLNPAAFLPVVPSVFVTTISQLPVAAVAGIMTVHVIFVGLVTATLFATISAWPAFSNFTAAPGMKLVPARFVMLTVVPAVPEVGVIPVTVGAVGAVREVLFTQVILIFPDVSTVLVLIVYGVAIARLVAT